MNLAGFCASLTPFPLPPRVPDLGPGIRQQALLFSRADHLGPYSPHTPAGQGDARLLPPGVSSLGGQRTPQVRVPEDRHLLVLNR